MKKKLVLAIMTIMLVAAMVSGASYSWYTGSTSVGPNIFTAAELFVTDMVLWLDAADADRLTLDGDKVERWADKSGNENHAFQSNNNYQPIYSFNDSINKHVLKFDGKNDHLVIDSLIAGGTSGRTIFIVAKSKATANKGILVLNAEYAGESDGSFYKITPEISVRVSGRKEFIESATDQFSIIAIQNDKNDTTGDIVGWLNGVSLTPKTTERNATLKILGDKTSIGNSLHTNISVYAWEGELAEIIVYDYALVPEKRDAVESYLAKKYGLSLDE